MNIITGYIPSKIGDVPQVATTLSYNDYFGAMKVRWGIGRDNYKVDPGIYAVGSPNEKSDVFVSANYKLSFDHVRKNLDGVNAWILVIDTKGVNVWCAAGKGTFGTKELVNRIKLTHLAQLVNHRRIILPQLGAVGVSAHQVKSETETTPMPSVQSFGNGSIGSTTINPQNLQINSSKGFAVVYGPVRAADIKDFINGGYKATREMRKVNFPIWERVKLVPVDFVYRKYYLLAAMILIFFLSGLNKSGISLNQSVNYGFFAALKLLFAYTTGIVLTPILLPYIPSRPFAMKGFLAGALLFGILWVFETSKINLVETISWFLLLTSISSFVAMNFTGSSTYTSLSGVKKEMKIAVPLQIGFSAIGLVLFVVSKFVN